LTSRMQQSLRARWLMRSTDRLADAAEMLALADPSGRPLEQGAARAAVHQHGVWHRSFHCWLVRAGFHGAELLLQRRALTKDTWPGAWDVSAAGHYRPGEGLEGGLREVAEELGLALRARDLVRLEQHREVCAYASGLRDREYQDVYLARCDRPLAAYCPDPAEVTGLVALPAAAVVAVARGALPSARADGLVLEPDGWAERRVRVSRATLVPRAGRYYERVARAAGALLRRTAGDTEKG